MPQTAKDQPRIEKPHKDYPLTPHRHSGRWCKKVRGKIHYFGKLDDPQAALELWLAQKDDLLAGRTPRTASDGLTVKELVNLFLNAKQALVTTGELSARTWADYHLTCRFVAKTLGPNTPVIALTPADFAKLRAAFAATRGPVALGNSVQRVRTLFKWAYDHELIEKPVRVGPEFKRPNKTAMRRARQAKGKRLLTAPKLRRLIDAAEQPMKSMILLALNCGLGNSDVGLLPMSALDLDAGWLDYPRPKTSIERRCPLWEQTVASLREWLAQRPKPKSTADAKLVFVTKCGAAWHKVPDLTQDEHGNLTEAFVDNPVSKAYRKLLNARRPELNHGQWFKGGGISPTLFFHARSNDSSRTPNRPRLRRDSGRRSAGIARMDSRANAGHVAVAIASVRYAGRCRWSCQNSRSVFGKDFTPTRLLLRP
jgi:integrase